MEEFDEDAAHKLIRFPNFHHSSPLVYYPQRLIKQAYDSGDLHPERVLMADYAQALQQLNVHYGGGIEVNVDPAFLYSRILDISTMSECNPNHNSSTRVHNRLLKCVFRDTLQDLKSIEAAHPGLLGMSESLVVSEAQTADIMNPMSTLTSLRLFMVNVRNLVQQRHVALETALSPKCSFEFLEIYIINEVLIIRDTLMPRTLHLLNYDQWLMLTDTMSCRFMVRVACGINDLTRTDQLPSWSLIKSIYGWGDRLLRHEGINAYAVIGEFESFVTGAFVTFQQSDLLHFGQDYISSIMENAADIMTTYGIPITWTEEIMKILQAIPSLNCLSEIFGLRKHWGNPMVDAAASGKAVQDRLDEELPVSANALTRLLATFNRMISIEFMKQHGQWPECIFVPLLEPYPLYTCWLHKMTRLPEKHSEHKHTHWSLMKFLPNVTMYGYDDQLRLLNDKSVSLHRADLDSIYVQKLCSPEFRSRPMENRRLMLEFLRAKQHSILDIFKTVMTGQTPFGWLANSASMKGTEMKHEKARIFAVLTFEMRQYFAATEDIIKTELFRYNPHQTMTMSEHELLGRLRQITRQMDPDGTSRNLSVVHIIDFSKWNLRMKYENTCLIFKSMDDFLGTPGLIENSHVLFSNMINLVQDPFNPPVNGVANTESDTIWRFHNAGWEGQRQKGWTLLTSALLSDLERQTGIRSEICGQGDNQVLLSSFPIPDCYRNPADWIKCDPIGVRTIADRFYQELESECLAIGLKIKTAETCRSLNYLNYGKRLYFNGVELSMMLKRVSKSITEPNNTYPTTESLLKTSEGASYSAGLYSHPSLLPYLLSRFSLLLNLNDSFSRNPLVRDFGRDRVISHGLEFNTQFISRLSKIPPSVGGPPQLSLASYMYRGHPDPACAEMVMLTLKSRIGCGMSQRILSLIADGSWTAKHTRSRDSLIKSPYSFNITLPKSALNPIQESLLPAVESYCNNPDIKELFTSRVSKHEEDILEILSTLEPFHPLVANDIYSRTIPGRRHVLLQGLSNTTSLGRLIYETREDPIVKHVADLEMRQLELWVQRVVDVTNVVKVDSDTWEVPHHVLVQRVRNESWGCNVVGVTVPHPLEQFVVVNAKHDLCTSECSTFLREHIVMVRHSENLVSPPGVDSGHVTTHRSRVGNPYLGSTINEGMTQQSIFCLNPNQTWKDLVRLNTIRRWVTDDGSNLDVIIKWLMGTRSDVPSVIIDLATGTPSRLSYSHRAALSAVVRTCAISTTSNMHSRIYLSSNRMEEYSHGDFNYHMPFGPAFLLCQSLICLHEVLTGQSKWGVDPRDIYHIHVRTSNVPVVFDGKLDVSKKKPIVRPFIKVPKMLHCRYDELSFSDNNHVFTSSLHLAPEEASIQQCKEGYANQLIGNSLVSEIIIRETMTMLTHQQFPHRETSISIGDIKLISVGRLCHAIASNIYLLAPFSIILASREDGFYLLTSLFLDSISLSFWNQFSTALSAPRNLKSLIKESRGYTNQQISQSTQGSVSLLKRCVAQHMWKIHENVNDCVIRGSKSICMSLFAPTAEASRYCWSKFVEVVICRLCIHHNLGVSEIVSYCRDFSANVHSMDIQYLSSIVCCIRGDYEGLKDKLGLRDLPGMPEIRILDLQYPWIDRLRSVGEDENEEGDSMTHKSCARLSSNPNSLTYTIPPKLMYRKCVECKCNQLKIKRLMHSEAFFCPTGLLSKSHYEFMDIIFSRRLQVTAVIILSSSTGTEALALSRLKECEAIYNQSYSRLGDFSSHMAGSYIPPAFINQPTINKLVNSKESVIAFNDIRQEAGVESIIHHVLAISAKGVIADLTGQDFDSFELKVKTIENILTLVSVSVTVDWVILKTELKCTHNGVILLGFIGQLFEMVTVENSLFSHPGSRVVHLIGEKRFKGRLFQQQGTLLGPIGLGNEDDLFKFAATMNNRNNPNLSYLPTRAGNERKVISNILEPSLKQACSNYIAGWGSSYEIILDMSGVRNSLLDISQILIQAATDLVRIAGRVAKDDIMVRSSILSLGSSPIYKQVNNLYVLKFRADLLRDLLLNERMDFEIVSQTCASRLSQGLSFTFHGVEFPLHMSVSKFYDHYSRYMYEILGYCYNWECNRALEIDNPSLFHKTSQMEFSSAEVEGAAVVYQFINTLQTNFDARWRWAKRAEILFLLLCIQIMGPNILSFSTPHDYIIEDILRLLPDVHAKVNHIHSSQSHGELLDAFWVPGLDVEALLTYNLGSEFMTIMELKHLDSLKTHFHIAGCYRVPWLGLIPTEVAFHCFMRCEEVGQICGYPDVMSVVDCSFGKGYYIIGCGCVDCVNESFLIHPYAISHYELDKLCSVGELESVRDVDH